MKSDAEIEKPVSQVNGIDIYSMREERRALISQATGLNFPAAKDIARNGGASKFINQNFNIVTIAYLIFIFTRPWDECLRFSFDKKKFHQAAYEFFDKICLTPKNEKPAGELMMKIGECIAQWEVETGVLSSPHS
jgi:hypothetical protein